MKNIECIINNRSYNIAIDKYKVIYGEQYENKFNVYKAIRYYFNKLNSSEWGKENNNKSTVKLNDRYIDIKDTLFFEVGYEWDYSSDAKLTTKSLILKYLEYALVGIEYEDSFNTVKELLYSLVNFELEDRVTINYDKITLGIENEDFNYKSLLKLLTPLLVKENLGSNSLDLTYEESIILQIKLVNKIGILSKKNVLVLAYIPEITENILNELENLTEDINLLSFSNNYNSKIPIENFIISDFGWLDIGNEESIYDYIINSPFTYSIEVFKSKLIEVLNNCSLKKLFYKNK